MKRMRTLFICLLLAMLLCGCKDTHKDAVAETKSGSETSSVDEKKNLSSIQKLLKDEECIIGTVFLGYVEYDASKDDINNLLKSSLESEYPFIQESVDIVDCGGQEIYALVPAEGWSMTVYSVTMSENAEYDDHTDMPVYETKANESIILRCNVSEIFPDTLVRLEKDGKSYDYRPVISLKDGHIADTDGCLDLTLYQDYSYENDDVLIARKLLLQTDEVKNYIKSGMSLIVSHNTDLENAMNESLSEKWGSLRGIQVVSIALSTVTLPEEDQELIKQAQRTAIMRDPTMAAATLVGAQADAMKTAAGNSAGAMTGFMGMGMAMNAGGGGMNAQNLFAMGQQQAQQTPAAAPAAEGWKCSCGTVNKGKFCQNCGFKKPEGAPLYRCDKCGWEPEDPAHPPKFCPECGDLFDENDRKWTRR